MVAPPPKSAVEIERENFRNLFKQTPEMVCILSGPTHIFEFVNEAHIKALGFDATGMAVRKAQPESVEVHGILDNVYQTGQTAELREIPVTLTGKLRYFNLTYAARRDEDGRINGIMILGFEVTDQVESRTALVDSKNRAERDEKYISSILENMSDAFFAVDKNWVITRCNSEHERIVQKPRSEQIGKSLLDLFFDYPGAEETKYLINYRRSMNERVVTHFEEYYPHIDIWTEVTVYPQDDGGLAFFFKEVSERKRAEADLRTAIRARDEFLSIASHELKTPLTSMKIHTQMFNRAVAKNSPTVFEPAQIKKTMAIIDGGLSRLVRLIDDMLDISRIQLGKLVLHPETVDLGAVVTETMERLRPELSHAGIELRLKIASGAICGLDRFRFEQVLTNLATNAVRYASQAPVELELTTQGDRAILRFRDYGRGIARADWDIVFKRFERLVSANDVSGMGLGLFICREIVEGHGGEIRLDDCPVGACFVIELPLANRV